MFGELVVFLILALTVGLARITRRPGPPRDLMFERVPDTALSDEQAAFFRRRDEQLETLHYRPVFNIRAANLPGANLSRFYTNPTDPAMILTSLLRVQAAGSPGQNADYVEIITRYQDGTELSTSNVGIGSPLARVPWKTVQRFPGLDAVKLKDRHDGAAGKSAKELRWIPEAEILDQWQETHRRWCEHQEREGRFRFDAASGRYLMTQSTGLRGIANFVNPFSGPIFWPRALLAALVGAVLPTIGLLALAKPNLPPPPIPIPLARIGLFAICGGAAGLAFPQRHYAWALLLALVPATLLPLRSQAFAVAWVLIVAHWGARWQNARRRLL
ncbi:MAG: hypothetical protein DMF82_19585 [Acidobacteria bacterium]|nr:MAG: hypothetical protein DMF82_19585 [Acidobacteriota bacterium]